MTAQPLAASPALAAAPVSPRQAAKAARAESFALPEPGDDKPADRAVPASAETPDKPDAPDPGTALVAAPLLPDAAPLPTAPALAMLPLPGTAPSPVAEPAAQTPPTQSPDPLAPQEWGGNPPATGTPSPPLSSALPPPRLASPIAVANARPAENPADATKPAPSPADLATAAAPAAVRPTLASAAAPAVSAPSVIPPADSSGQQPGQNPRNPARQPPGRPPIADGAAPLPPFRMEPVGASAQTIVPPAVEMAGVTRAPLSAASAPDMAADPASHMPDVVVDLVGEGAIDVTISAATAESLDRMALAEPDLRRDLAELGAEVEAIRMELRPEAGPEKGAEQSADKLHATATPDGGGRQGDRGMRQSALREDWPQLRATGMPGTQTGSSSGQRAMTAPFAGPGRIDRYA